MSGSSTPLMQPAILELDKLDTEARIQLAVNAINNSPLGASGLPTLSISEACRIYNVKRGMLTNRLHGVKTKQQAHAHQRLLSEAQEEVLVDWAKTLGHRGTPVTLDMLGEYASEIAGQKVGVNWPKKFMERHPELKIKKTAALEECRAQALNQAVVAAFYEMIKDLIEEYEIPVENIYNADEKGIQLGVGKSVAAIVDRNQKNVQQVENGNREMVTIIETVCADGESLPPSVIFQAKRRVLEWGKENPANASISTSENGWTDKELGSLWLERDFHPMSQTRNKSRGYRLLILNGHNSHCTFRFCRFAERNRIIVVCLPSHMTHALQPCDVGVFSPLSSSWKSLVNRLTRDGIPITKLNFLKHYHVARHRAFKPSTIISAFAKSGIWPLNPNAIPIEAYEPSKITTTKGAMPVSADLTPLLEAIDEESIPPNLSTSTTSNTPSHSSSLTSDTTPSARSGISDTTNRSTTSSASQFRYRLAGIPPSLPHTAGRADLRKQIDQLRKFLDRAQDQLERDHAIKILMVAENERLRQILYHKKTDKKKTYSSSNPRHMTGAEHLDELAYAEWKGVWKAALKEAGPVLKAHRKLIEDSEKEVAQEKKRAEMEAKRQERDAERQRKDGEKLAERARKKEEGAAKAAEKAVAKAVAMAEKEAAQGEGRARDRGQGQGRGRGIGRGRGRGVAARSQQGRVVDAEDHSPDLEVMAFNDEWQVIGYILYDPPERPRPRPVQRQPSNVHPPVLSANSIEPQSHVLKETGGREAPRMEGQPSDAPPQVRSTGVVELQSQVFEGVNGNKEPTSDENGSIRRNPRRATRRI